MKKFVWIVAVAAAALVVDSQFASAGRRGGHGGCGGGGCGSSGCSTGGCYSGGCSTGGCYSGGCSTGGCGYASGGCSTCGTGSYVIGGSSYAAAPCATCAGGVCTINPNAGVSVAQASETEATLVVTLPEDAKLTIDNEPTTSTSANRVFVSPSLETGKAYQYTLKAQVVRDGKTQTTTQKVTVRAGQVSRVELTVPATGVAQ